MPSSKTFTNIDIHDTVDNFLKELRRCEGIFKTHPHLEIIAPPSNQKSIVDDIDFQKIAELKMQQLQQLDSIDCKLSEMGNVLHEVSILKKRFEEDHDMTQKLE